MGGVECPRYRFLGGKGGTGKTTCAAAIAVAEAAAGVRTLLISTDPAPSLGAVLGQPLGGRPRRIAIGPGHALHVAEVNASRALERWLADRRAALERVVLRGTWLDEEDVGRLLRLSLPGIDEIAALLELSRLGRSGSYDLIVVDTAPTGHTIRMLAMPETLLAVASVFDRMQAKHRILVEALRGGWQPEADDLVIAGMAQEASDLAAMLRDRSRVTLSWVSLAELMSVEETVDAVRVLEGQGIHIDEIIVNRLTPAPGGPCRWCAARRGFESRALWALHRRLGRGPGAPTLRSVLARDAEPTGLRALSAIGAELRQKVPGTFPVKVPATFSARAVAAASNLPPVAPKVPAPFPVKVPATLVMFGGKGGVGKTTCAAAAAIAAATSDPARRVQLISTDPAHSLGDALGVRLGDESRRVRGAPRNLMARELDAAAGFDRVRDRYHAAIDALFDRFTRGTTVDAAQDRRVMQGLIDLAPPGIDELAAIIDVVETLDASGGADLVILDTAPSGHALRLLEMPAVVQDWTRALMTILLKYQPVIGIGDLGTILLRLSQGLGRLRTLLGDSSRASFIVVTRTASLPRAESVRLLARLARLGIHAPLAIVNAVGAGTCARCLRRRSEEARELARLRRDLASGARRLAITAATMPPPRGPAALDVWRRSWRVLR